MRFIKYLFWYVLILLFKPLLKVELHEIEEAARFFSYMKIKDIIKFFKNI